MLLAVGVFAASRVTASCSAEPIFPWRGSTPLSPVRVRLDGPSRASETDHGQLGLGSPALPQRVRRPAWGAPTAGIELTIHERFLDHWLRVESQETGPVRDCILGAEVLGCQSTESRLSVDLLPDPMNARMELQLRGRTRNQTENRTPQAVILSTGEHHFLLSKLVRFDGTVLTTRSPAAFLFPHQVNRGAVTSGSLVPVLGRMADQMALSVAEQRRPAAERVTADRITRQIVPQFNQSVDQRLTELNLKLKEGWPRWLTALGIEPAETRVATTQTTLQVGWGSSETTGLTSPRPPEWKPAPVARLAIHASMINRWIDQGKLEGRHVSWQSLEGWRDQWLLGASSTVHQQRTSKLFPPTCREFVQTVATDWTEQLGQPTVLGTEAPALPLLLPPGSQPLSEERAPVREPAQSHRIEPEHSRELATDITIILADREPLRVEFHPDGITLIIRAAFQVGMAPPTDFHRIEIPYRVKLTSTRVEIIPGPIQVASLATTTGPWSGVACEAIRSQIVAHCPLESFPAQFSIPRADATPIKLQMSHWQVAEEWLLVDETIVVEE